MSQRKPRDAHKERCWQGLLQQWRASGLSVRAFCQRHQLTEANFYAWRRILAQREAERPAFAAVQVVADDDPAVAAPLTSGLELRLADGCRIGIVPGFDAPTLRRLLALLAEGRPC